MRRSCAASITVLPLGTWTGLPSTSRLSISRLASNVGRNEALLVVDMGLELVAKMLDEALDRQRRGVAQRANRPPRNVGRHRNQQVEVFVPALTSLDAIDDAPHPARPLA